MKDTSQYKIVWHNDHASGVLPLIYNTREGAEKDARAWFESMVEDDDDPEDAAREYGWEVLPYDSTEGR